MASCGRSEMILPLGVGNLQKGERYVYSSKWLCFFVLNKVIDMRIWTIFSEAFSSSSPFAVCSSAMTSPVNGSKTYSREWRKTGPRRSNLPSTRNFYLRSQSFMNKCTRRKAIMSTRSNIFQELATRMENAQSGYGRHIML